VIVVLIAAYNEGASLRHLLPRIPAEILGQEIIVVVASDGSSDDTVAVAEVAGCRIVTSSENRGKGATLRMGMAAVEAYGYEALVLMDGDGQHDPDDLEAILAPVITGMADMTVGSRYADGCGRESAPWNRYAVRCVTTTLLTRLLGRRFSDPYCGFRALSRDTVDLVDLEGDRYQSELEMLFAAAKHELSVVEVPIAKVYGPDTSKMAARRGRVIGRLDVVSQYGYTMLTRTRRMRTHNRVRNGQRSSS